MEKNWFVVLKLRPSATFSVRYIDSQTQTLKFKKSKKERKETNFLDLIPAIPASTTTCERGFSAMGQVQTVWRARLNKHLYCGSIHIDVSVSF